MMFLDMMQCSWAEIGGEIVSYANVFKIGTQCFPQIYISFWLCVCVIICQVLCDKMPKRLVNLSWKTLYFRQPSIDGNPCSAWRSSSLARSSPSAAASG